MGKSSQKTAARLSASDSITANLTKGICHECEDQCWTSEVLSTGYAGGEWYTSWLFMREHQSLGQALQALGRWQQGHGNLVLDAENQAWLLEHQPTLW